MGGPGIVNGKRYECMNNFGIAPFEINGKTYVSTEAYLQCCKCAKEEEHEYLRQTEKAGNDIWSLGQRVQLKNDWEIIKVDVMLQGNRAKFHQHPQLLQELLGTGSAPIRFRGSTANWCHYNAVICTLIREENKENDNRNDNLIQELQAEIDGYRQQQQQRASSEETTV